MPSKEFLWFQEHYEELRKKYPGKTIAIVNNKIVGIGDTLTEADMEAQKVTKKSPFFAKVRKNRAMILWFIGLIIS